MILSTKLHFSYLPKDLSLNGNLLPEELKRLRQKVIPGFSLCFSPIMIAC